MEKVTFTIEDVFETFKALCDSITDDCTMAGAELFACELLGCSEETLYEAIK